ncbi:hypothetical protein GCM10020255_102880 [Rhodococcus baikonurensis]
MAKTADLDEARVSLLVELLSAAGLIASGTPDPAPVSDNADEYWTPTLAVDGWLNASTARRWEVLASAWVDVPRVPWMIGLRDSTDKPIAALSEEGRARRRLAIARPFWGCSPNSTVARLHRPSR